MGRKVKVHTMGNSKNTPQASTPQASTPQANAATLQANAVAGMALAQQAWGKAFGAASAPNAQQTTVLMVLALYVAANPNAPIPAGCVTKHAATQHISNGGQQVLNALVHTKNKAPLATQTFGVPQGSATRGKANGYTMQAALAACYANAAAAAGITLRGASAAYLASVGG